VSWLWRLPTLADYRPAPAIKDRRQIVAFQKRHGRPAAGAGETASLLR
jgi:hypothetical protein